MVHQIELEGFEGQRIEVKPAGIFSSAKLLVNGEPAPRGPKRGQMILLRNDGKEAIATWREKKLGFDVPNLVVDGEVLEIGKSLKWYEWVWSILPVLLVFVGGVIGAGIGIIGFMINTRVFRSEINTVAKYFWTAAISVVAVIAYFVFFTLYILLIGALRTM